jgi:tRNA A37 threonylcarbamoyladenosine biosynthesis protein TsaE
MIRNAPSVENFQGLESLRLDDALGEQAIVIIEWNGRRDSPTARIDAASISDSNMPVAIPAASKS